MTEGAQRAQPAKTGPNSMKPGPGSPRPGFHRVGEVPLVAVAVAVAIARGGLLLFRLLDHQGLGGQQHAGDRRGVLHGGPGDLDRVDDALGHQVAVLAGGGVVAVPGGQGGDLRHHDRALHAGVQRDPAGRLGQRALHDPDAGRLVTLAAQVAQVGGHVHQGCAAPGDDALLDGGPGGGDGVLQAVLLLLQLHLGGGTGPQHADPAGQLGQPLLQLLAVPVGVGVLDLGPDLPDPVLDLGLVARAVHDRGVVLGDDDPAGAAQGLQADRLQLDADLLADHGAAGQDGHVGQHGLAAVAEAGRLHRDHVEQAADLVDHQGREGLALDVLGHDQQRPLDLRDLLEQGQEVGHRGDLGLVDQDVGVLEDGLEAVLIGDEVRRDVALVELETFGELQLKAHRGRLLDGDDPVLAYLGERLGDQLADLGVLRRDRRDVRDLGLLLHVTRGLEQPVGDLGRGGVDAALEVHRVRAGGDRAQPEVHHRLGQDRSRRGAVPGDVVGLGGDLLGELGPEVLVRVLQLHLLGDGHAVVGDGGGAPFFIDDDVAAARAERHLDGVGELVDAALEGAPGVLVELQDLGHRNPQPTVGSSSGASGGAGSWPAPPDRELYFSMTASTSRAESTRYSSPWYLTSVPPYLLYSTTSPTLTSIGTRLAPASSKRPGPTARTSPSWGFSLAVSGITRPDAVVCSASSVRTTMRSSSGLRTTLVAVVTISPPPPERLMASRY